MHPDKSQEKIEETNSEKYQEVFSEISKIYKGYKIIGGEPNQQKNHEFYFDIWNEKIDSTFPMTTIVYNPKTQKIYAITNSEEEKGNKLISILNQKGIDGKIISKLAESPWEIYNKEITRKQKPEEKYVSRVLCKSKNFLYKTIQFIK